MNVQNRIHGFTFCAGAGVGDGGAVSSGAMGAVAGPVPTMRYFFATDILVYAWKVDRRSV